MPKNLTERSAESLEVSVKIILLPSLIPLSANSLLDAMKTSSIDFLTVVSTTFGGLIIALLNRFTE